MLSLIKDLIVKKTAKVAANNGVVKKKRIGRPVGKSKIQQMLDEKEKRKEAEELMDAINGFELSFNRLKTILNKALYK